MSLLTDHGVTCVYHYTPLHYLPFIARIKSLLCKPSILKRGFPPNHLRSKSNIQDVARGFSSYTHLTLDPQPPILNAKLAAGFPHLRIAVPVQLVEATEFSLCRFNVAMARYLRRDGKPGFPESPSNGRYYEDHQIPIARTVDDKAAMLRTHIKAGTMIEVLVHGDLALTDETTITCFASVDAEIANRVLSKADTPWRLTTETPPGPYPENEKYRNAVLGFVEHALSDHHWKGDGLEFDRV